MEEPFENPIDWLRAGWLALCGKDYTHLLRWNKGKTPEQIAQENKDWQDTQENWRLQEAVAHKRMNEDSKRMRQELGES